MPTDKRVFINSYQAVTCAANDAQELWQSVLQAKSGIKKYDGFLPEGKAAIGKFNQNLPFEELLVSCVTSVLSSANIKAQNCALFIGSSVGGMQNTENILKKGSGYSAIDPNFHTIGTIKNMLKKHFSFQVDYAFSTACTSSANALGFAYECVKKGIYQDILVLGADAITLTTVCGFNALGVLSPEICRPFCKTSGGMNVSEGIGALLISDKKTEQSIEFLGAGYSSDAYHMTHPEPNGKGAVLAMQNALKCAALKPSQIEYINAHGTGTNANDTAEAAAIFSLFGDKALVSSTKHITGHALGAAGAIEAIIACQALSSGAIPQNCEISSPINENCSFAKSAVMREISYAMSNSFAFGGNNTSLVFGKLK